MRKVAVKQLISQDFQTAEAIRILRTNLQFSGESVSVVGLTSFDEAEGKSTIAFQLAASLAELGKQVLLLDADLRKSVLATRLKIRGKVEGLSHCLTGQSSVPVPICDTDQPGMHIMFAGSRVPNSAELLGGKRFKSLIHALKKTYDYVIVDAAPLGQVVDCAVIAPDMDGVLLVIDTTHNSYKLERRLKSQLEKSGGKILGAVLNRVNFKEKHGYYGKGYGYGYGEK